MKLFEHMGKELFREFGIPVPKGRVAKTPDEVAKATEEIGDSVIKSQILSGKRGKAGGIKFTADPEEAKAFARDLLGKELLGLKVEALLVEEKLKIDEEYYLAITIDGEKRSPIVLASSQGGMDVEDVPEDLMLRYNVDLKAGMTSFVSRDIADYMGLSNEAAEGSDGVGGESLNRQFRNILEKLYEMFNKLDAELIEINPLVVSDGKLIAADAKITIDDEALYRQPDIPYVEERTETEQKAQALGLSFVELDGDIGVMANGAGITLATLDMIQYFGGRPANFLDAGGGAGEEKTAKALELVLERNPKAILINIFGGITRCDDVANAFVSVQKKMNIQVPVVIRLVGTNQKEGQEILKGAGIETFTGMAEAAKKVVELAG